VKKAVTPRTKLIVVATPNNPTGTVTEAGDILEIAGTGPPLLVDEAYIEFGGQTIAPLVSKHENIMVMRSFSKWAGLAGLRVGYGVFPPWLATLLMRTKLPFAPGSAAAVAVRESLADLALLRERVSMLVAERERLFAALKLIPWLEVFPSQANFVFCRTGERDARSVQRRLEQKGILVRYFDVPLLENALRISVGRPQHTDALLEALAGMP
jgi:histidinol-phosphate aminotransferase